MSNEINFKKYKDFGVNYHYIQVNKNNIFNYNSFVYGRYKRSIDIIKKIIKENKSNKNRLKILDVGCGDAVLLFLLKKELKGLSMDIYGVDLSEGAIGVAKKKINEGVFKKSDVYNLDFKNEYFDIVVSSDVIEHVKYPDKMLKEIKRVCKKNGSVIVSTPIRVTENPVDPNHYSEFFENEFLSKMSNIFTDCKLIRSHELFYHLLYNKHLNIFGKKLNIFRYLMNLIDLIFKKNFFIKEEIPSSTPCSYMHVIGKNNI